MLKTVQWYVIIIIIIIIIDVVVVVVAVVVVDDDTYLGLLFHRPSISSLLQSATSVIKKCDRY